VEANIGLTRDRQRLVEERDGLRPTVPVERNLGSPLQREDSPVAAAISR
jgi:hypothetical protein